MQTFPFYSEILKKHHLTTHNVLNVWDYVSPND